MSVLLAVREAEDVLPAYRDTPIADLLAYHNLGAPHRGYDQAEMLVGMCMDHRKRLHIPERFAYVMRVGGARILRLEFQISFAIAVGGVKAIAVIGHDQCGMVDLHERRDTFVQGLADRAGWDRSEAAAHFDRLAPEFEIGGAAESVVREAAVLREKYPAIVVAPLMYLLADGRLYQIDETQVQV